MKTLIANLANFHVSPKVLLAALKEVPSSSFSGGIGAVEVTPVPWDSVVGVEEAKQQLKRAIQWPLERPDLFKVFKVKPSRGCLLYGPPGEKFVLALSMKIAVKLSKKKTSSRMWENKVGPRRGLQPKRRLPICLRRHHLLPIRGGFREGRG